MRNIDLIIVHCSDSMFGDAAIIDVWHKANGWRSCGYHYVIQNGCPKSRAGYHEKNDGVVERGRFEHEVGAHVKGLNSRSIGICMIGTHFFTWKQFHALRELIADLQARFPKTQVIGHRDAVKFGVDIHGKTCPKFDVAEFMQEHKSVIP